MTFKLNVPDQTPSREMLHGNGEKTIEPILENILNMQIARVSRSFYQSSGYGALSPRLAYQLYAFD
jgi:hypothetical protein